MFIIIKLDFLFSQATQRFLFKSFKLDLYLRCFKI